MPLKLFAKNRSLAVLMVAAFIGLAALGYGGYGLRAKEASFREASRISGAPGASQAPAQALLPIPSFNAPGLRLAITSAQVNSAKQTREVSFAVANSGLEELEGVEVLLLDFFTAEGKLDTVVGRKFNGSLKPATTRNLLLMADAPLLANHSYLLTVRAIEGKSTVQEINALDLLKKLSQN